MTAETRICGRTHVPAVHMHTEALAGRGETCGGMSAAAGASGDRVLASIYNTDRLSAGREAVGDDDGTARRGLEAGQLEAVVVRGQHVSGGRLRQRAAGDVTVNAADRTRRLAVREVRLHARHAESVRAAAAGDRAATARRLARRAPLTVPHRRRRRGRRAVLPTDA